jgi:FAD/FMN-containing dehydrogenase
VRFISGDNNHLSPQYGMGEGSCAVTLTIYGKEDIVEEYFDAVYDATRTLQGRIHWGKHFSTATSTAFRQWYDGYDEFSLFRRQYDPRNVFVNDFIKAKFNFGN